MTVKSVSSGMPLNVLLHGIAGVRPPEECTVTGVCLDSRMARPGELFLACAGTRTNGIRYIDDALRRGIAAVAVEAEGADAWPGCRVPVIPVPALGSKAGFIASRFFGEPSSRLRVIGITGTNGKTSVSHYIAAALQEGGQEAVGLIGTMGYGPAGDLSPGLLTTPDPVTLQQQLALMLDEGIGTVVMEVSSHALQQGRVAGVAFDIAVFTNLSRDHLDFHGDMNAYGEAKRQLFEQPGLQHAVLNLDDAFGRELHRQLRGRLAVTGYGLARKGDPGYQNSSAITAEVSRSSIGSLILNIYSPWGEGCLECALSGRFNAYNLLAALAVLGLQGIPFQQGVTRLQHASCVPGRMECFAAPGTPRVIVDYAHSPDALAQALLALRPDCRGKLICIFGCGGNRDKGKRPQMGAVAESYADCVVVTNDNPRSEPPQRIIDEIVSGMSHRVSTIVEPDRAKAITLAIRGATVEDVVLIAGKGHETYQEIGGRRLPFSDRQLVKNLLQESV